MVEVSQILHKFGNSAFAETNYGPVEALVKYISELMMYLSIY